MTRLIFTTFCLLLSNSIFGQFNLRAIEITPYLRWDTYPQFSYSTNGVTSNKVKINGISWGVNTAYIFPIRQNQYLKASIGYYKYAFNNVNQVNSLFGKSKNRIIEDYNPPGGITPGLVFTTNKYWYNTVSINIEVGQHFDVKNNFRILYGLGFGNFYTFSQHYHITYPSPNGNDYRRKDNRYFGFSACGTVGLQKKIGRTSIGPLIILPIFDTWKQDRVFPQELNSKSRTKWLKMIGVGISYNYSLK